MNADRLQRRASYAVFVGLAQMVFFTLSALLEWGNESDVMLSTLVCAFGALQCVVLAMQCVHGPVESGLYLKHVLVAFFGLQLVIWPTVALRILGVRMYSGLGFCYGVLGDGLWLFCVATCCDYCRTIRESRRVYTVQELELARSIQVVIEQAHRITSVYVNDAAAAAAAGTAGVG